MSSPLLWKRFRLAVAWCVIPLLLGVTAYWVWLLYGLMFPQTAEERRPDPQLVRFVLPQDPVTEFPVKPVREAAGSLNPSELVLGVTIGREARAYPINMLNEIPRRKVLNDRLGGRAIAATW